MESEGSSLPTFRVVSTILVEMFCSPNPTTKGVPQVFLLLPPASRFVSEVKYARRAHLHSASTLCCISLVLPRWPRIRTSKGQRVSRWPQRFLFDYNLDALRVLKQEHALILKRLLLIEDVAKRLSATEQAERQSLTESLLEDCKIAWQEIFQHIRNEEEALFPVLEQQMNEKNGLVHVLRYEHGEILGAMISLLGEIVRGIGNSDRVLGPEFAKRISKFRSSLSEHISREDRVLFWLAELHLTPSDKRRVSLELAEVSRLSEDARVS